MNKKKIDIEVHAYRSKKQQSDTLEGVKNIYTLSEIETDYDIAFVTNPTSLHYGTLMNIKNKAKWFFVEKPLFERVYPLENTASSDNYYVAAPLRYKQVMNAAKNIIDTNKVLHARAICSSYLPDWRKEDYRESYSANEDMGGGIELDCIHELDYVIHLFGLPLQSFSMIGKVSNLEISSNDTANYMLKYENMYAEVHVDYFGKAKQRKLEIITEEETFEIDFYNNSITSLLSGEVFQYNEESNSMYLNEMEYFFKDVMEEKSNHNNLVHALEVLKIAKGD